MPYLKPATKNQVQAYELSKTIYFSRGIFSCLAITWKQNDASDRTTVKYLPKNRSSEHIGIASLKTLKHFEKFLHPGEYTVQIQVQNPNDIISIRNCSQECKQCRFIYILLIYNHGVFKDMVVNFAIVEDGSLLKGCQLLPLDIENPLETILTYPTCTNINADAGKNKIAIVIFNSNHVII